MLKKGIVTISLALIAMVSSAEQEYYTWVDENGVTNYAAKKPSNQEAQFVTSSHRFGYRAPEREAVTNDRETAEASPDNAGEVDPDAIIADERAKFEAELAEEKRFNCDVGKKNLSRLETFGRIRIKGEDGKERVMTDEEMEQKKVESRSLIRENCKA